MNNHQNLQRCRVIPRWLDYNKAVTSGELYIPRKNPAEINEATKDSIRMDLQEFLNNPTSLLACRLMGAGIIVGNEQLSRDMASYIKDKGGVDEISIKLADKIMGSNSDTSIVTEVDVRIANIRRWISVYHHDSIAWIDLARAFTIKGLKGKAQRAAIVALQLAPYDRYVVRCATRFFLHIGDYESAWYYINRASKTHFDPWIKATEVNVANIADKATPSFKKHIPKDLSHEQLFHFSELLESYGYLELESGNERKARKQMKLAWLNPSESVITHAEWIIRNKLPALKDTVSLEYFRSPEANTWQHYSNLKVDNALEAAREWELEEPYSKYPFIMGACVACNADKPEIGVEIAMRGLIVSPENRVIQNNLCYALLRTGNTSAASKYINKLYSNKETESDLIALATTGLYEIKMKNIEKGREIYTIVIKYFKQKGNQELQAEAILNLALAEMDVATPGSKTLAMIALENTQKIKSPSVIFVRKIVQDRLNMNLHGSH